MPFLWSTLLLWVYQCTFLTEQSLQSSGVTKPVLDNGFTRRFSHSGKNLILGLYFLNLLIINNIVEAVPRGGGAAAGGEGQSCRLQHVLLPHVPQARYCDFQCLYCIQH